MHLLIWKGKMHGFALVPVSYMSKRNGGDGVQKCPIIDKLRKKHSIAAANTPLLLFEDHTFSPSRSFQVSPDTSGPQI